MSVRDDSMLGGPARFATTRWSVVRRATDGENADEARAALESLCATYWPAVVAYLRRRGRSREDALDLAQAFFARLLEKDWLARADEARGSFRAFLATMLRRFAASEAEAAAAVKRGGGALHVPLSIDPDSPGVEPVTGATPEQAFERAWVRALLASVLDALREEYAASGQAARFAALEPHLVPGDAPPPFADMARELGLAESSCRVAVFRARRRYRDLLRDAVTGTVAARSDVDAELDALLAAVAGGAG